MDIRNLGLIEEFIQLHRDADGPLRRWVKIVTAAGWPNFPQCRSVFPHADQVNVAAGVVTVFNIKGNDYRLVVAINYVAGRVSIRRIMTHSEYSKDQWKDLV